MMDVQHAGALRSLTHIFPQDTYPFPRAAIRSRWASEMENPDVDVHVIADDEGRIAGFAAVRDNELLHFGTAVETWGTGLAAAAHAKLLKRLAATGVPTARLRVLEQNHWACRFYEKQGWHPTDRTSRTSSPPHPVLVEYELDL
jgi:RimJ/RimL family protein N-acetyltransferase